MDKTTVQASAKKEKDQFRMFVKVVGLALVVMVISELIGTINIPLGSIGQITFLPIIWAIFIGMIWGTKTVHFIDAEEMSAAQKYIFPGLLILIARLGMGIGPNIELITQAGVGLILQEIGNLCTLFALPLAVWFGLGRQSVGACFCLPREGGLAIIGDKYGLDSEEGRGVMSVFVIGTILGSIFYSILAGLCATYLGFHPFSLAMASGMGSFSMMFGSLGTLTDMYPHLAKEIRAFASASSMLTTIDGIWISAFIGLPLANLIYKKMDKNDAPKKTEDK